MEPIVLSLKRSSVKVSLEQEDGTKEDFLLQELSGAQRDVYLTQMAKKMKYSPDGKPLGMTDFNGLHANLLTLALVTAEGQPVTADRIQSWKSTVIQKLFEAAQEMNGMNKVGQEDAKNA